MRPHDRGVHADQFQADLPLRGRLGDPRVRQVLEHPGPGPGAEPGVDRGPRPLPLRDVTPATAGAKPPQHHVELIPHPPRQRPGSRHRQLRLDQGPLSIRHVKSPHPSFYQPPSAGHRTHRDSNLEQLLGPWPHQGRDLGAVRVPQLGSRHGKSVPSADHIKGGRVGSLSYQAQNVGLLLVLPTVPGRELGGPDSERSPPVNEGVVEIEENQRRQIPHPNARRSAVRSRPTGRVEPPSRRTSFLHAASHTVTPRLAQDHQANRPRSAPVGLDEVPGVRAAGESRRARPLPPRTFYMEAG